MAKAGWVYVLSQDSGRDGLYRNRYVKVGRTKRDPDKRADQLKTGSPYGFQVDYAVWTENREALERAIHGSLTAKRVETGREFFRPPLSFVIAELERLAPAHGGRPVLRLASAATVRTQARVLKRLRLYPGHEAPHSLAAEPELAPLLALHAAHCEEVDSLHARVARKAGRAAARAGLAAWLALAVAAFAGLAVVDPAGLPPPALTGLAAVAAAAIPARGVGLIAGLRRRLRLTPSLAEAARRNAPPMLAQLADPEGAERPAPLRVLLSGAASA